MSEQNVVRVRYWFGTYEGEVCVVADANTDDEQVVASAKRQLRPHMSLSMAYERFEVLR